MQNLHHWNYYSSEIVELTRKDIGNVHRDIKSQLMAGLYGIDIKDDSNLNHNKIQGVTVIFDRRGYWGEVRLNRYHADILVSGYEVKYRAAIVKRWHELEEQSRFEKPTPRHSGSEAQEIFDGLQELS
jgi:hypothetical protein